MFKELINFFFGARGNRESSSYSPQAEAQQNPVMAQVERPANFDYISVSNEGYVVRFAHATSSRFATSIQENGLLRPNLETIARQIAQENGVPEAMGDQFMEMLEYRSFGIANRQTFEDNPIYCSPLERQFYSATRRYALNHVNGGEFSNVCGMVARELLGVEAPNADRDDEFEPHIYIISYNLDEIVEPLFEKNAIDLIQLDVNQFREGNRTCTSGAEIKIRGDIGPDHLEGPFSIDQYRIGVGGLQ